MSESNGKEIMKSSPSDKKVILNGILKEWGITIITAIVLGLLLWYFVIYSVWIRSGSMIPTLEIKDKLLVTRVYNPENLKRGDIVVFKSNEPDLDESEDIFIKRLIGLPGDKIEIKKGIVFVNGEELKEDYVKNNEEYDGTFNVPNGKYFFLGDNRAHSNDARYWEDPYISGDAIEGKAQIKYYPIKDFEILK